MAKRRKRRFNDSRVPTEYTIKVKAWRKYTDSLRMLSDKASGELEKYLLAGHTEEETLEVAHALVTKYGEASSELACQMYEALAEYSGASVAAAEAAATATYGETARAIRGEMLRTRDARTISSAAGRLVKLASVDTMTKNALRDGAEWAWIPSGDTCPYCLMLASKGWQRASDKIIKNGHATHIHNNCDCTFAVRLSDDVDVEGYDPDTLYDEYINAGDTQWERINTLRRRKYAENREYINAQKRAAYRKRTSATEHERMRTEYSNKVQIKALDAEGYVEKYKGITGIDDVDNAVYNSAVEILNHRNGTDFEDLHLIDAKTGEVICKLTTCDIKNGVEYDAETKAAIKKAHEEHREIIAVHNHPGGLPPSLDDGVSAYNHGYAKGVAVGHNMEVYTYGKADNHYSKDYCKMIHEAINDRIRYDIEFDDTIWYNALEKHGMEVSRK